MSRLKSDYQCSLDLTFDLIGGKWKLRILWHIMNGDNRFSLLLKGISDITEKMLTTQLRELCDDGLMIKRIICKKPINIQYELSNKYYELQGIINTLCDFSKYYGRENNIEVKE